MNTITIFLLIQAAHTEPASDPVPATGSFRFVYHDSDCNSPGLRAIDVDYISRYFSLF